MLEYFKTYILGTLSSHLDVFQMTQRKFEEDKVLVIFFPRCRKKHLTKECLLNAIDLSVVYDKDHPTNSCPLLLGLKEVHQSANKEFKPTYFMGQQKPWPN